MPTAKGNPALTVGAAILGTAIAVGSPPPSCLIGAPPVRICADSAIVLLIPDLDVVLGLEVLDGLQGASAGQWSNEGDLNLRCDAVWVAPNWEGSNAAAAGAAASIGSGGGDGGLWRDGNGSGISGSRPQRESGVATRSSRAKDIANGLVLHALYPGQEVGLVNGQHFLATFQFRGDLLFNPSRFGLASPQGSSCGVVVVDSITENLLARRCHCGLLRRRVLLLLLR